MNLADFLRQGPLTQQRMADASAFDRDSELANMMRQHGTVQDPNMVQEPSVLGNLPIDVPQPTQQDMQMGAEQVMNMMPMAGITAWHGSPHKFTKFDMSKIGTGEGAQAYGHGLYMAENPGVAKDYQKKLASRDFENPDGSVFDPFEHLVNRNVRATLQKTDGDVKATIDRANELIKNIPGTQGAEYAQKDIDVLSKLQGLKRSEGNLYKVDIPDDQIAKMLDWDKPLSEQPESVRNALPEALSKRPEMTGAELYNAFSGSGAYKPELNSGFHFAKHGSDTLKEKGIPGIKYLDQGSRGAKGGELIDTFQKDGKWHTKVRGYDHTNVVAGEPQMVINTSKPFSTKEEALSWADKKINTGTSNFVLFSDEIAKILERNDQPIGELAEMLSSGKKVKP